jgi:hypothetical protein
MLFNLVNLPYWIFLGIGILLFLTVIISGGGDSDSDLDADADADAEVAADARADFDLGMVMGWLGFGKAPLVLLLATDLSLWGVTGWILNVTLGSILSAVPGGFWSSLVLIASLTISLFLGSLISRPLGKVFASFGEDISSDRLIGCIGTVSSANIPSINEGRIGQVDIIDSARNQVTIPAATPEWATTIPRRGDRVWAIDRYLQGYLVIAKDSPDEDRWLQQNKSL